MKAKSTLSITIITAIALAVFISIIAFRLPSAAIDFHCIYQSLTAFLHHSNPYKVLLKAPNELNVFGINLNPPLLVLLLSPIAFLSFANAYLLWSAFSLVFIFLASRLCLKLIGYRALESSGLEFCC